MLAVFIVLDVLLIRIVAFLQHPSDTYSEGKADVAVGLHLRGKTERVHRTEYVDERVIACYLFVALRDEVVERACLCLEVFPEFSCLLAGIGEVEDIISFLRIKHQ